MRPSDRRLVRPWIRPLIRIPFHLTDRKKFSPRSFFVLTFSFIQAHRLFVFTIIVCVVVVVVIVLVIVVVVVIVNVVEMADIFVFIFIVVILILLIFS